MQYISNLKNECEKLNVEFDKFDLHSSKKERNKNGNRGPRFEVKKRDLPHVKWVVLYVAKYDIYIFWHVRNKNSM